MTQASLPGIVPSSGAQFGGADSEYRYRLWRTWDSAKPLLVWVMLNPSTADANADDPTIRKVRGFTERAGCGSFAVINLFARRSTDPDGLRILDNPIGPDNDDVIESTALMSDRMVLAWGAHKAARIGDRVNFVLRLIARRMRPDKPVYHLGLSKDGAPNHPLMLPYTRELVAVLPLDLLRRADGQQDQRGLS